VTNNAFDTRTATPDPRLYQSRCRCRSDQGKTLTSITFKNTVLAGVQHARRVRTERTEVAAPTSLTLSNNLTIAADSTLEVSGYTSVTLGTLRAGRAAP